MTEIGLLDNDFERKWGIKRLIFEKMGRFWEEDEQLHCDLICTVRDIRKRGKNHI